MSITQAYDFFIQWHLTERCNLRCKHCYQEGQNIAEMPLAEISRIVDEVSEMIQDWQEAYGIEFLRSFNVTGGEPFLRADIFVILEKMVSRGFEVYVLSNGTLISPEKARILADLGIKGVQVSLEGPEEIHDAIRGAGSFSASLSGIQHLLDAGLKVSLNTTLSQINADYVMSLVGLAASLGVQRLGFARLVPSGRGLGLLQKMLSPGQVKQLYETIFALQVRGLEMVSGDPVAAQMSSLAELGDTGDIPSGGCAAGVAGLTLLPDGTITPCRRLNIPLGQVPQDSLREIWAVSPVLALLRDKGQYQGKCGACHRWAQCRGCRAIAYAYSLARGAPDFLADDPQCFLPAEEGSPA